MADLHNVFMSHYSGDVQQTRKLQDRLAANGCIVRNSAAKEDEGGVIRNKKGKPVSDAVIARYLKMRINWAGTFIVIIGEHTHERAWVNYEIEQANKMITDVRKKSLYLEPLKNMVIILSGGIRLINFQMLLMEVMFHLKILIVHQQRLALIL